MSDSPYREAAPRGVLRGFWTRLYHRFHGCPDCKVRRPCNYVVVKVSGGW